MKVRNSTYIYRITENRADVVDGKLRKGFIEGYVWRIAMRKQLGLGLMGCGSRQTPAPSPLGALRSPGAKRPEPRCETLEPWSPGC